MLTFACDKCGNNNKNNIIQSSTRPRGQQIMIIELTPDEIGWVKYALARAASTMEGRDPDMTRKEEKLLMRLARKIEKQEEENLK